MRFLDYGDAYWEAEASESNPSMYYYDLLCSLFWGSYISSSLLSEFNDRHRGVIRLVSGSAEPSTLFLTSKKARWVLSAIVVQKIFALLFHSKHMSGSVFWLMGAAGPSSNPPELTSRRQEEVAFVKAERKKSKQS